MQSTRYRTTAILICLTIAGLVVAVLTDGRLLPDFQFSPGEQPTLAIKSPQAEQASAPENPKITWDQERQLFESLRDDPAIRRALQRLKHRLGMKEKEAK